MLFYGLNAGIPVISRPAINVLISYVPSNVYKAYVSATAFIRYLSWQIPFPPNIYLPHLLISLALSVTQALNMPTIPIVISPFDCMSATLQHTIPIA